MQQIAMCILPPHWFNSHMCTSNSYSTDIEADKCRTLFQPIQNIQCFHHCKEHGVEILHYHNHTRSICFPISGCHCKLFILVGQKERVCLFSSLSFLSPNVDLNSYLYLTFNVTACDGGSYMCDVRTNGNYNRRGSNSFSIENSKTIFFCLFCLSWSKFFKS